LKKDEENFIDDNECTDGPYETINVLSGVRLDIALVGKLEKSRGFIQSLIQGGRILVNEEQKKPNYRVQENDIVKVSFPEPRVLDVKAEQLELDIVYEDEDVLLVNKPRGMVVHPAPGAWTGTLVNALLYHCKDLSGINGVLRPGIVHRIDKDTSGLLVVAKNDDSHKSLATQLKEHTVVRNYRAIVHGSLSEPSGTIDAPIGRDTRDRKKMAVEFKNSKNAVTNYFVRERFNDFTEIKAVLETGRTHQIRVHMSYISHPVLGDLIYGPRKNCFGITGQLLHAETLGFIHPRTGEKMEFKVEPPREYLDVLEKLKGVHN